MIKLDLNPPDQALKQFGYISLIGFPLAAFAICKVFALGEPPTWAMWGGGIGVLTLILSLVNPQLVKPIYLGLTILTIPIGFVISMVLMLLIFFGMFLPVGLMFRISGRDQIKKRPDPELDSYWTVRGGPRPAKSYYRLY